eukprot:7501980-Alexandrium_andersonii.AAC.1
MPLPSSRVMRAAAVKSGRSLMMAHSPPSVGHQRLSRDFCSNQASALRSWSANQTASQACPRGMGRPPLIPDRSCAAKVFTAFRAPSPRLSSHRVIFRLVAPASVKKAGGPHHVPSREMTAPTAA